MQTVKVNDKRYNSNKEVEVRTFEKNEKETTIIKTNKGVSVFSSISTDITKLLKIATDIEILSVTENGTITSIKCTLATKQLSFRRKLSEAEKEKKAIVGKNNLNSK